MTQPIRAAVKTDIETSVIREFERPRIGLDDGLLRVESSGVGGSDPEMYRRANTAPCIMGHEVVGTVEELGEAAAKRWGLRPGDRIALHEYLPCWHCHWCLQGDFRLCMEADFFNVKDRFNTLRYGTCNAGIAPHLWGGFAEHLYLAPNAVIHRIPADMDARHATLAVPLGNGVQWAVLDGGAGMGKTVLVFGPGQQGLGCVLAAKAAGSAFVILAGMTRDRARLDLSLDLGADLAVDVQEENLYAAVMAATGGRGVDVVVDTTGDPDGSIAAQAVALSAKGAWLSLNGLEASVPLGEIKKRYLTVRAPRGHSWRAVQTALDIVASRRWPVDKLCSHDFGLEGVHDAILATAGRGTEGAIHVTVSPGAEPA
ncbi:zinc-binding dehydrogenase [Sphingomonas canadensis]|uniref:Zinc-binding dehydrogenase n=1 Tax=Sphingomonas canadensis TaxID=1219257 RepID=A0ABW3HBQ2_9SPHN|nr:alcohol dehydrogenase catalytic domain-containing protein [Sphingomonas canadensis]MCW3838312.1 alcohol dehydrogenase catalytic domain-containing protein [Sphingomonas canadensis]